MILVALSAWRVEPWFAGKVVTVSSLELYEMTANLQVPQDSEWQRPICDDVAPDNLTLTAVVSNRIRFLCFVLTFVI